MLVFGSAEEAGNHSLGRALFAITGVANIFALPQFLTVTKNPETSWDDVIPAVVKALEGFLD